MILTTVQKCKGKRMASQADVLGNILQSNAFLALLHSNEPERSG